MTCAKGAKTDAENWRPSAVPVIVTGEVPRNTTKWEYLRAWGAKVRVIAKESES